MHVGSTVARARKPVPETEISALGRPNEPRKGLDRFSVAAGDACRPLRTPRAYMFGEFAWRIGVAIEIIPVGLAVSEQTMHHGTSERAVGTGTDQHRQIGLLHGAVHVDVDGDDLRAPFLARAGRVRHHVDLSI